MMKRFISAAIICAALAIPAVAATNTYQVTGPVLEVKPDMIVVGKGSEKWQIARDASSKVSGDIKVGDKVTVEYRMIATTITVKSEPKKESKKK